VLPASDLEINVLEFRQRSFQFDRLATVEGEEYAVFSRSPGSSWTRRTILSASPGTE
jgi:hypothetical protein